MIPHQALGQEDDRVIGSSPEKPLHGFTRLAQIAAVSDAVRQRKSLKAQLLAAYSTTRQRLPSRHKYLVSRHTYWWKLVAFLVIVLAIITAQQLRGVGSSAQMCH